MALAIPLVNGFLPAFADVQMRVSGLLFVGVASIEYSDNLTRGQPYGAAAISLGLTKGSYKAKGSVELYLPAAVTFETALAPQAIASGGLRFVPVSFSVGYAAAGIVPLPVITDSFTAYLGEISQSQRVSDDAITRKYEILIPGVIWWNGVPAITEFGTISAVA